MIYLWDGKGNERKGNRGEEEGQDGMNEWAYIFCATSAPLSFFSYCASMACCSCLTSFAYISHSDIKRSVSELRCCPPQSTLTNGMNAPSRSRTPHQP